MKETLLAENQTDFIFAVAGEEYGFIGCTVIVGLLTLIAVECIRMSLRAKDLAGKVICCGMGSITRDLVFSEYLCGDGNGAQYRYAAAVRKLWTDLPDQSVHRHGYRTERRASEQRL